LYAFSPLAFGRWWEFVSFHIPVCCLVFFCRVDRSFGEKSKWIFDKYLYCINLVMTNGAILTYHESWRRKPKMTSLRKQITEANCTIITATPFVILVQMAQERFTHEAVNLRAVYGVRSQFSRMSAF
jgi:hypothetical protein